MESPLRLCVVVPVFNHGLTVQRIVRDSQSVLPVIVVNDGSTDQTTSVLAELPGLTLISLPKNQGKAAALKAGFARAAAVGYSHAITIDADGQHPTEALGDFIAACRKSPDAFIIGVRDLKAVRAPILRRLSNALSTFWFHVETRVRLPDTQCGYRVYPLARLLPLPVKSGRYAYELEIMVKAAWAGIPLLPLPVQVDYASATSQLSHFRPIRDFLLIACVHASPSAAPDRENGID